MLLFALAYLAGGLTILSPCILPVLPFVFARSDRPFTHNGLPLLGGMVITFAGVATLAAVGGGWAVQANGIGRQVALGVLALCGLALLLPELAERLSRPLVAIGARLSEAADSGRAEGASVVPSFLLGVATGLLWAPCAGPILGVILTGAALQGANLQTSLLLFTYAAGAATSLGAALLLGSRVFGALKRSLHLGEGVRRGLGIAVLAGVAAIAFGLDTGLLSRLSAASTAAVEQNLLNALGPMPKPTPLPTADTDGTLGDAARTVEGVMPALDGATAWLNTPPLSTESLRGKVVLVDFWTYSCINCLRSLPYVQSWAERYREAGLVVIGVHAPEFAFEKSLDNVQRAVRDLKVSYPVALDNDYRIWRGFDNHYWPAHYVIDAQGRIRHHAFGEGGYEHTEQVIRDLLVAAGHPVPLMASAPVTTQGIQVAADTAELRSPETYIGYERATSFVSPGGAVPNQAQEYTTPSLLTLNHWGLNGGWTVEGERAVLSGPHGSIVYRFRARDLHLVLGPGADGKPVRFVVRLDGAPPASDHGVDSDAFGSGTVTTQRLYQLVRQTGAIRERTFEIEFLDSGAQAFAFTFG